MDRRDHILSNPKVSSGKPVVKGTWVSNASPFHPELQRRPGWGEVAGMVTPDNPFERRLLER